MFVETRKTFRVPESLFCVPGTCGQEHIAPRNAAPKQLQLLVQQAMLDGVKASSDSQGSPLRLLMCGAA